MANLDYKLKNALRGVATLRMPEPLVVGWNFDQKRAVATMEERWLVLRDDGSDNAR